jgi:hypothetical protein
VNSPHKRPRRLEREQVLKWLARDGGEVKCLK